MVSRAEIFVKWLSLLILFSMYSIETLNFDSIIFWNICAILSMMIQKQKIKEIYPENYRKVANNSLSRLVARFQTFRRLMKGKFDAYVLRPLAKTF